MDTHIQAPDAQTLTWLIWVTHSAEIAAYVVQWLEFVDNLTDEIIYLWSSPRKIITYVYAFSRYFPLCIQPVNILMSYLSRRTMNPKICLASIALKFATVQIITTCVEIILIFRVHALYNCVRRVGILLGAIWLISMCLEYCGTVLLVIKIEPGPTGTICIPKQCAKSDMAFYFAGCGFIQSVLLFLTLFKTTNYRQLGWLRAPVVSLMLRDGIGTFLMVAISVLFIIGFELARDDSQLSWNVDLIWNVEFAWFTSVISVIGCRLILNMRKLAVKAKRTRTWDFASASANIQFTSIFETDRYFSAGDVRTSNESEDNNSTVP